MALPGMTTAADPTQIPLLPPDSGEAVAARYARLTAKEMMTLEDSIALSAALGRRVAQLVPPADLAIGLANGGTLPALVAAQAAGIDCRILRIRRKSSAWKLKFKFLIRLLRLFPGIVDKVRNRLKRLDLFPANPHEFDQSANLSARELAGRHVVIVDDCIDSGGSIAVVRRDLLEKGAASVRIAVIGWATKFDSEALHAVTPDIHLHRIMHHYPWSLNNPEH